MQWAVILGLVSLIFAMAVAMVAYEDKRARRRDAGRRQARLALLGEVDPLAPHGLRVER